MIISLNRSARTICARALRPEHGPASLTSALRVGAVACHRQRTSRNYSTSGFSEPKTDADHPPLAPSAKVLYHGPMTKTLVTLKRVSVATLFLSTLLVPLSAMAGTLNPTVLATMLGAALITSGGSTALIQYCVSPYVTRIIIPPSPSNSSASTGLTPSTRSTAGSSTEESSIILETLNFFGNRRYTVAPISKLSPSSARMFACWTLDNATSVSSSATAVLASILPRKSRAPTARPRQAFYVHEDLDVPELDEFEQIVKRINVSGRGAAAKAGGGTNSGTAGRVASWDEVVKDLRAKEGKQ
ncbi:hypothetical protein DFS34DRAFT_688737 [Phlyctochytrium arcticum]|nr:hypothetical protein DFS34DRAFT_688737 [Phlyctochytrium arcticum]